MRLTSYAHLLAQHMCECMIFHYLNSNTTTTATTTTTTTNNNNNTNNSNINNNNNNNMLYLDVFQCMRYTCTCFHYY